MNQHLPTISAFDMGIRLLVALVLSGAIGFERELRERGAGLRTHIMVGLGSALFTLVSAYGFSEFYEGGVDSVVRADPTRIAAQIVTGIGFLGAGAIIRNGMSVRGLTTAATLWAVAAIGLCAGAGFHLAAVMTTILILVGLGPMRYVERKLHAKVRPDESFFLINTEPDVSSLGALTVLEEAEVEVENVSVSKEPEGRTIRIECSLPVGVVSAAVCDRLLALPGVRAVSWDQ